jgi:asparagine synthetase A
MFPFIKLSDLLARLRFEIEDIKNFLENPYPLEREEISLWLLRATVLIRALSEIFDRIEHGEQANLKEVIQISGNTLEVVESLIQYLEKQHPLFLETVTVFYEPLPEKLKQLRRTFNTSIENASNLDLDEFAYLTDEIAKTLEVFLTDIQKFEKKLYN